MNLVIDYTPQPHQLKWHNNKTRFLVAVCGRQIGKTTAAVNELIKKATVNPKTRNWYVTNDYKQAKRNVWDLLMHYTPKKIISATNKSELSITLINESKIELIGVENAESLRGAVVHFMILDEYADFPREVWPTVLRPMLSTTEGDVWFIGTPKGMGNDLFEKFHSVSDNYTSYKIPACGVEHNQVVDLASKYASRDEIQSAYEDDTTPNKDYFSQEYLAEFTKRQGVVYGEWPLDNFRSINYDPMLELHISMDFGVNDPTSIMWIQEVGGEFRVIDYYESRNANIEHFAQVINAKPYKEPSLVTGDPAGKARTLTTGTSPIDELRKYGIHVKTKDGVKIEDQIRLTHKFIPSLFVSNGNNKEHKTRMERFRDCLLNYRYPEIKETARNQSNEKPIHDEFSHAMRAMEYYFINYKPKTPIIPKQQNKNWALS